MMVIFQILQIYPIIREREMEMGTLRTVISLTMAAMAELAMLQSCDSLNSKSIVPISNFIIWNGANFYKQVDLF